MLNTKQNVLFKQAMPPKTKQKASIANDGQKLGQSDPAKACLLLASFMTRKLKSHLSHFLGFCKHQKKAKTFRETLLRRIEIEPFSSGMTDEGSHIYDSVTDRRELETIVNEQSKIKQEIQSIRNDLK